MKNVRIFSKGQVRDWTELVLINEEEGTMKIYCQELQLGFPFSETTVSLAEYGYKSADDYYNRIRKREQRAGYERLREIDVEKQIKSEINGLLNLFRYRMEKGAPLWIKQNNGTFYCDIFERLKEYGVSKEEALKSLGISIPA